MSKEIDVAISIAKEAGALLKAAFETGDHEVKQKEDSSPVTDADMASHDLIKRKLQDAFPGHIFLSEESPDALNRTISKEPTWIIDPLDGTSNFIAGLPLFAVVLVLVVDREPQVAVMYDPIHDDLFAAEKNKGATLNGSPMSVSSRPSTKGAMLFAGRGFSGASQKRHGGIIYELEQQTRYFRRLGAASIMISSVACGRADSVILTGSKAWDVVAGALLVREAGGRVTDYCGVEWTLDSEDLVATNGLLHDELIAITNELNDAKC